MEEMVYAFRVVGDSGEPWYGDSNALPEEGYRVTRLEFEPDPNLSPFAGQTLEMRHGLMPDDGEAPYMRAHAQVGEPLRRVSVRADVREILFPGAA
jgi:hypothetical protein